MTVRNIVAKFGRKDADGNIDWSNFSSLVEDQYERGNYETYISVVHLVSPNEDYVPGSPFSKQKKFSSCYYESGTSTISDNRNYMQDQLNDDRYLRESGFDYFPVLVPRWLVVGEDVRNAVPRFNSAW